jgi:hypothetical protein
MPDSLHFHISVSRVSKTSMKINFDWQLTQGIASASNFAVLLVVLLSFPVVLRLTGAFSFADIDALSRQHLEAFLKFCFILTVFLWVCFSIALVGIQRKGSVGWQELVGARWNRSSQCLVMWVSPWRRW